MFFSSEKINQTVSFDRGVKMDILFKNKKINNITCYSSEFSRKFDKKNLHKFENLVSKIKPDNIKDRLIEVVELKNHLVQEIIGIGL